MPSDLTFNLDKPELISCLIAELLQNWPKEYIFEHRVIHFHAQRKLCMFKQGF